MTEMKTRPTQQSAESFVAAIADAGRRGQCEVLLDVMRSATKCEPVMWGSGIIGFGSHHYRYASGREGDWFLVGFAPRKTNLTVYVMDGFERHQELLDVLGRHRTGKSCLYIRNLADIDINVLRAIVASSVRNMQLAHSQERA